MLAFWVEGIYRSAKTLKKAQKSGKMPSEIEPFGRVIWAQSAQEALHLATEALQGGQWIREPTVSRKTEEDRMRQSGAPQLPGFGPPPASSKTKKPAIRRGGS